MNRKTYNVTALIAIFIANSALVCHRFRGWTCSLSRIYGMTMYLNSSKGDGTSVAAVAKAHNSIEGADNNFDRPVI